MAWPKCNSTLENQQITETPIWHDWTFHLLGLWISAVFGLIAITLSFILIYLHATHYLKPWEQRHIIRILFMVPVYAAVSFLSYKYYTHSVYFDVLRDCYEAFAIASFFSLICHYTARNLHDQKNYFRAMTPIRPWIWPMGWLQKCCGGKNGIWRTPRSGLTWFNVIWTGVFQYCFIRVFMTIVAVVTQIFNRYCLESLNPAFSHVWVMVIEAGAVTIAMYCLIQFYIQLRHDIAQHKPLLKVLAIKLVIFLSFWQTLLISFLTSTGAVKANAKFQTPDIKVGIPAMLLCIEMALFSIFHLWAFSYKPYIIGGKDYLSEVPLGEESSSLQGTNHYQGGFMGVKALIDAMNPWDMIKAVGRAAKWLFRDRKHRENDSSYAVSRIPTNMDAFEGQRPNSNSGQKLSNYPNTAYTGAAGDALPPNPTYKPQPYRYGGGEENANLLANAQTNPSVQPYAESRYEHSPYRNGPGVGADTPPYRETVPSGTAAGGDIGVAQTKDDANQDWQPQRHQQYPPYPQDYAAGHQPQYQQQQQQQGPYFDPPPLQSDQGRGRRR